MHDDSIRHEIYEAIEKKCGVRLAEEQKVGTQEHEKLVTRMYTVWSVCELKNGVLLLLQDFRG